MLTVTNLTYRIAGHTLLDDASVNLPTGKKVGLVGRNGAGKTTLFGLITGAITPESGTISIPERARIGAVAQEAPATDESLLATVIAAHRELAALTEEAKTATDPQRIADIQNRLVTIDAHSAEARAGRILSGLGFSTQDQQRPCHEFSGGWRMRVALAAMLFAEPDLLLLDEPTNYLDLEGTLWLESFLSRYPHSVLVISHDRDLLNRAVDGILHLTQKKLTYYSGPYDTFEDTRRMQLELEAANARKIEAQRAHMQAFVDRFRAQANKARQAQSRLKALARLKPIIPVSSEATPSFEFPQPDRLSPPLITIDNGSVGYEPGQPILTNITCRIDPEDRIALLGRNGNGKSTFAKLITERLQLSDGKQVRARRLRVSFFTQHQLDELNPDGTPYSHMAAKMPGARESVVRSRLGPPGFVGDKALTKVSSLSGGEKARLLLALIAAEKPAVLVFDEPTNHLDIDSREALIQAINSFEGAVMVISHDRHFLEACVDRLWLVADGTVKTYDGDLADYEKLVLAENRPGKGRSGNGKPAAKPNRQKKQADQSNRLPSLKASIEAAEKALEKLEKERARVTKALTSPLLYENTPDAARKLQALTEMDGRLAQKIEEAEAEWLAAQDEYEKADRKIAG